MKFSLLLSLIVLLILAGCTNNKKEEPKPLSECDAMQVTYSGHVFPIIQQNCATYGCHVPGFPDGDFSKYEDLKAKVDNGSFKHSVIEGKTPVMPETGKLPDAQILVLQCWLNDGAPNN